MPTETRVISSKPKPKIGERPSAAVKQPETAAEEPEAGGGKSRKKLIVLVLAVVLVLGGGAGYWFLLGPGAGEATATEEPEAEPGDVLTTESLSINLADGRYLRLGLGLQLTAELEHPVDPARALDLAIGLFSGRPVGEVSSAEGRAALKAELVTLLDEAYHGEVMDVYFTDYVTQ